MGPKLPAVFLDRPIAHRGLHGPGRPENSCAAVQAAVAAGYGIEIDIQPSAEGTAMVFHDYDMGRLTGRPGAIGTWSAAELATTPLLGGAEGVPRLAEVLALVAGQAPLLIEIKDQDGALGPNIGPLEDAVAADLDGYEGPVALMSFNPHSVAHLAQRCPDLPRGLTTDAFRPKHWPTVPRDRCIDLATIPDATRVGASFISHAKDDLTNPRLADLSAQGLAILCWTIRSPQEEAKALKFAANITFEGYEPEL